MKNLKQNLVQAILCLGVVSVSLVACQSDQVEDTDVITLDQLDDVINEADSTVIEEPTVVEDTIQQDGDEEPTVDVVENEEE